MTVSMKRTEPTRRNRFIVLLIALLTVVGLFLFPDTMYAAGNSNPQGAPPTVEAEITGSFLRIRAMSGFHAVEAVYVNDRRFNHRVDSALVIDISGYIVTGDTIAVHAVDFAGNYSNIVLITPPSPAQPPAPNNLTPDGQGEILDHLTNSDLIEFITINTPAGNVFHLVIDHTRSSNNVFLLNPVTEWDLLSLAAEAELDAPPHVVQLPPVTPPAVTEQAPPPVEKPSLPEEPPPAEPTVEESDSRAGTFIFMAIAGAGAFGVIYYLKILKPKKEREMYGEDSEEHDGDDGFEDIDDSEENEDGDEGMYDVDSGKYVDKYDS